MPQQINDGDIVKALVYCRAGQQVSVNRLIFRAFAKTGVGITLEDFASNFKGDVASLYKVWMSATSEIEGVRAQVIRPVLGPHVSTPFGIVVGTAPGSALPPQVAVDMQLKTANVGKMNRGRQYLPFWDDSFLLAGGFLTVAGVTAASNYLSFLLGPIVYGAGVDTQRFELVIDSKGSIKTVPPTPPHVNVVTSGTIIRNFATQRRRSAINKGDSFGP